MASESNPPSSSSRHDPVAPDALSMRKLLRSRATGAFLTKDGTWTQDLSEALELLGRPDAARGLAPEELEIYYSFDKFCRTEWDFVLPLK